MSRLNPGFGGGHILVDFDGTLAVHAGGNHEHDVLGEPIPAMVAIIKGWLDEGREVRVFTARVYQDSGTSINQACNRAAAISAWCRENIGRALMVTCLKSPACDAIYDDRAYHVEHNSGLIHPPHPA